MENIVLCVFKDLHADTNAQQFH